MTASSIPLRTTLLRMITVSCATVLVVTITAFLAYELLTFRESSIQQLRTLGAAVASNSTAALAFDNPDDAAAVLSALKADPHITAAALYDTSGTIFATFPADLDRGSVPATAGTTDYGIRSWRLSGFQPVVENERSLGTLYVESDLGAVFARLQRYAVIALVVAGLSWLAAWLISRRLQYRLLQPILALADTARAISDRHDYSVRASQTGALEFDQLTDAFNHMLTQIQDSEGKLHAHLGRLGLLQHITHAIGERQDMPSIFQVVLGSLEKDMPVDFACVLHYEASSRALTVGRLGAASRRYLERTGLEEKVALPVDENGLSRCVAGELVYEPDVAVVPFPFPQRFAAAGLHSLVIAPLVVNEEVSGMLVCARRAAQAFSSGQCEFLRQLSEHVALASRQAGLYTALQQAYDDLRQSQLTLLQQERLRALGQMASGIAHDINNAISPVSLYTESLLERETGLSERARGYLQTIQRAIGDVARTLSRMREFYRDRETQPTLARLDLNQAAREVIDLTRPRWSALPQSRGAAVDVVLELAPDLPAIMAAENEVRDALTNLVFNAVDAMPTGGSLTVRTRKQAKADDVVSVSVEVSDTGTGMDEDTRRKCLEPFYTTKGERGTGLGLAMVYGMVQRHSAELEIESALGKGTTVRVGFLAASAGSGVTGKYVKPSVPSRPLRILLVDDDPMLMQSLHDILSEDGHLVTPAAGGQAGIDAFGDACRSGRIYDLVITDLGMPYVDGRKVAAGIKALSRETPVILLTGWGQRLIEENDLPPHVDRVLSKPPRLPELRAAFAELAG